MTTYTLQISNLASGTLTVKLHSMLENLVIPNFQSLSVKRALVEKTDATPGVIEPEEYVFDYTEDYSAYSEGFWFKVLGFYAEIQLLLDEGSGDTHLFWGVVVDETVAEEEFDLSPGKIQRRGSFRCVSALAKLRKVSIDQLNTELRASCLELKTCKDNVYPFVQVNFVNVRKMMAAMLKLAFGAPSVAVTDVPIGDIASPPASGMAVAGEDLQYVVDYHYYDGLVRTVAAGGWGFASLYFMMNVPSTDVECSYFVAGSENPPLFNTRYADCFDLMKALLRNFCFVGRHYYDIASGRHKMRLLTRGSSFTSTVSFADTPSKSTYFKKAGLTAGVTHARRFLTSPEITGSEAWAVRGLYGTGPLPPLEQADIDISLDYHASPARLDGAYQPIVTPMAERLYASGTAYGLSASDAHRVGRADYYDYGTGAWPDLALNNLHAIILARYLYGRFSPVKSGYLRQYPSLKANDGATVSQANAHVLRRTVINDGVMNRTYYATESEKNPFDNTLTVRWNEV